MGEYIMKTYYTQEGKYQQQYDRLSKLIPDMGRADTVAGEMMRCLQRLSHEMHNNGMDNNSSGAVNYLLSKGCITVESWQLVEAYSRGRAFDERYMGVVLKDMLEGMIDQTVFFIMANPELEQEYNNTDMYEMEGSMQQYCSVCDEDITNQPNGTMCDYCFEEKEGQWHH